MGFKSILQSVLHGAEAGLQVAAPFAPLINSVPIAGTVFGALYSAVTVTESLVGQPASGPSKKTAATALVKAAYPDLDSKKLSAATDALVTALNFLDDAIAKPAPAKAPKPAPAAKANAAAAVADNPPDTPPQ